ncbi:hypothetical protein ACE1CI_18100 [Aerosakkonemataceae cyanobacterium BLCC-F50]|uniref:HTH cro/C1-type domain-containing protein n=1 Tax=Floridaenema flaviceps BLCC-F50 TaxID=3153642 RepID=A0ABV4XUQ4_9CYAN
MDLPNSYLTTDSVVSTAFYDDLNRSHSSVYCASPATAQTVEPLPHSNNQINAIAPQNSKSYRRRGMILTQQGWDKLLQAEALYDEFGRRYTYEELGERSLLDSRTISRILSRKVKVDKRTLQTFFEALNLQLEPVDYKIPPLPSINSSSNSCSKSLDPRSQDLLQPLEQCQVVIICIL